LPKFAPLTFIDVQAAVHHLVVHHLGDLRACDAPIREAAIAQEVSRPSPSIARKIGDN
jgi:hypothetical protein